MEVKLKSGKKLKVKDISIDERDELLDSVSYEYKTDGTMMGVKMMHSTMTKWIRTCLAGASSEKFLKTLSLEERTEIFTKLQNIFFLGEGKASK